MIKSIEGNLKYFLEILEVVALSAQGFIGANSGISERFLRVNFGGIPGAIHKEILS